MPTNRRGIRPLLLTAENDPVEYEGHWCAKVALRVRGGGAINQHIFISPTEFELYRGPKLATVLLSRFRDALECLSRLVEETALTPLVFIETRPKANAESEKEA